jgi:hypothetical protein
MLSFLWAASRGYRLRPWDSPYLRWRVETYWGTPASELDAKTLARFAWEHRRELLRYLGWTGRMRRLAERAHWR